jgi:hypothetical protein
MLDRLIKNHVNPLILKIKVQTNFPALAIGADTGPEPNACGV